MFWLLTATQYFAGCKIFCVRTSVVCWAFWQFGCYCESKWKWKGPSGSVVCVLCVCVCIWNSHFLLCAEKSNAIGFADNSCLLRNTQARVTVDRKLQLNRAKQLHGDCLFHHRPPNANDLLLYYKRSYVAISRLLSSQLSAMCTKPLIWLRWKFIARIHKVHSQKCEKQQAKHL